jgi:hypothetical protein
MVKSRRPGENRGPENHLFIYSRVPAFAVKTKKSTADFLNVLLLGPEPKNAFPLNVRRFPNPRLQHMGFS